MNLVKIVHGVLIVYKGSPQGSANFVLFSWKTHGIHTNMMWYRVEEIQLAHFGKRGCFLVGAQCHTQKGVRGQWKRALQMKHVKTLRFS